MNRFAFALLGTLVTATLAALDFKVENIQEPWRKKGPAVFEIQGNKPEKALLSFSSVRKPRHFTVSRFR